MAKSAKRKRRLWDAYAFPGSDRNRRCAESLAIPKRVLSLYNGAQKNTLRGVRSHAPGLVRPALSLKDIAQELRLHWETVKELDEQYMRAQLARMPVRAPQVIGIDEISIRKGHDYRIVVSDLIRCRAIWFGGQDRKQASMKQFYDWLGERRSKRNRLVVMDMWKAFYNATKEAASQAAILYDIFHVMRHLGEVLDGVRKAEYARLKGRDRKFKQDLIKALTAKHQMKSTSVTQRCYWLLNPARLQLSSTKICPTNRSHFSLPEPPPTDPAF